MKKVTPLTRKLAFNTIRIVAKAALEGNAFIPYSELAKRLELKNETGRGLRPVLEEAARMCIAHGLPDVCAVIVTKESLEKREPFPSLDSFVDGKWPLTGLTIDGVVLEQEKVHSFQWREVPELGLNASKSK